MKRMILLVVVFACACAGAGVPKNIILFIGDGMSTPQRMTADEFVRKQGRAPLVINRLPFQATTRTCSASSLVTDSAAAATAIACGTKTYNHGIGVDAGGKPIVSCAEVAKKAGIDFRRDTRLRHGIFGAEPWTDEMRRKIAETSGIVPHDIYGLTEISGPGVAASCPYCETTQFVGSCGPTSR